MKTIQQLRAIATQRRIDLLTMIHDAGGGHSGGSLSCADILVALHYAVMRLDPQQPQWPNRDRFILSKGHSVEGYYAILADLGFFPKEELKTYCRYGSRLIGHPSVKVPGVEMNTGALGHGLPVAVGMALAARMDGLDTHVYVLMGDGEQAEGSVWEAAMAAANYKLENLTAIVDRNRLQISGCTEDVMALESLSGKWAAFGWDVREVDGHDMAALLQVFQSPPLPGKPKLVLANTVKGCGVSYMQNVAKWHHGVPNDEELAQAIGELNACLGEVGE